MHRVRQSLPFFKKYGWLPVVLAVEDKYVEMAKDNLLLESIPSDISVYKVSAFSTKYTRKLGIGNLGIRAFWQLYMKGNRLLRKERFDLVYFSTTVFASIPLGRLWKIKFGIPFIIDMQDPWRNDYYLTVSKEQRPPKFWFAYRLNKYLECFTIPRVDGLISVSIDYILTLKKRYPTIADIPEKVLTFGAHRPDLSIALKISEEVMEYKIDKAKVNIIYAGVVPTNMLFSIEAIFKALQMGIEANPNFKKINFHFIGTNYATGSRMKSILAPLIKKYKLEKYVFEYKARIPYFQVLKLVKQSDLAVIPGTLDSEYTASKLYPYIMTKTPIIAVFHEKSSVLKILKEMSYGKGIAFNSKSDLELLAIEIKATIESFFKNGQPNSEFREEVFLTYDSNFRCKEQVSFFNKVTAKE